MSVTLYHSHDFVCEFYGDTLHFGQYPVQQHHPPTFENASIMIRETEEEDGFKLSRKESPDFRMNSLPPTSAIIPTHQVLIIDDAQLLFWKDACEDLD